MKSPTSLVRLKKFQLREKQRHLLQLETMEAEFKHMADALEAQIIAEEKKAGIADPEHFAYPIFAKAARQRRENLLDSVRNLSNQKDAAALGLRQTQAELERAQALEQRQARSPYTTPGTDALCPDSMPFVQRRAMIG